MKRVKALSRDLLGLVTGETGDGPALLGRALLSSAAAAALAAATIVERCDIIAVAALFLPLAAAAIWTVAAWEKYAGLRPQTEAALEKATPKNPSPVQEVKESTEQEPAVETPQAPAPAAPTAADTGKENPSKPQSSPSGDGEGEKAAPEKTRQTIPGIEGLGGLRKSSPKEAAKKGRPEGEVDLAHEWPGVSEILADADAVLKKHGVRGWWLPRQELQLRLAAGLAKPTDEDRRLFASAGEEDRKALFTLGGLYRQAFMMREAINSRIDAAGAAKVKDLPMAAAIQGAIGSLAIARDEVATVGSLAIEAMKALGATPGIHCIVVSKPETAFGIGESIAFAVEVVKALGDVPAIHCPAVSKPETAFGVDESIAFAREVVDKFGAGGEKEAKPEPPAPKPSPVTAPRVRHPKPSLGDVEKATPKNRVPAHQAGAEGGAPTLADLWPDLTGQGGSDRQ